MSKPRKLSTFNKKLNTERTNSAKEILRDTVIIPEQKANREKLLQNILDYNIME